MFKPKMPRPKLYDESDDLTALPDRLRKKKKKKKPNMEMY